MSSRLALRQLQRQRSILGSVLKQQQAVAAPATVVALFNGPASVGSGASSWSNCKSLNNHPQRWFSSEAPKGEAKKEETVAGAEDTTSEEGATAEEAAAPAEPTKEEQLEAQVKELKDQLMRSLAEAENTRKIAKRDVDSAKQFAIKSFAKSLLDVSDNLSRALESVPKEALEDKDNTVLTTLYEGIEMTDRGLLKAFEMNGLIRYGQAGEDFDPNLHDALYEYPDPEKKVGTIGQVMKPGFKLHSRVLRPAEVGVVKEG